MSSSDSSNELSPRKTYRLMAGVALAIIMLLGLAIYSLSRMETAPWTSSLAPLQIQTTFRKDLPQFEYVDGNKKLTPQNLGGKWTLMSFWSYSCPPCLAEMPSLNRLALGWQGPELEVLTVNVDDENSENYELAKRFLQETEISLPTIFDRKKILAKAFEVTEYPRHFLINTEGKIIWEGRGAFEWDQPAARDQLLKLTEQQTPETTQDPEE